MRNGNPSSSLDRTTCGAVVARRTWNFEERGMNTTAQLLGGRGSTRKRLGGLSHGPVVPVADAPAGV